MFKPPLVVSADVAIAPFISVELADVILKVGEVVPVIAIGWDTQGVVPIVIPDAIGSVMDGPNSSQTGCDLVKTDKPLEKVQVGSNDGRNPALLICPCDKFLAIENLGDKGFSPMPE